ncbi:hypothetical protein [Alloalcanivorax xenomutans]|uniref:hypothetical protein n=1 Tax=Alloalcanivorax xenomutans TaxID=1094342 RepID=UPI00300B8C35
MNREWPRRLRRLLDYALPLCMAATLVSLLFPNPLSPWIARPTLLIYLLVQWRRKSKLAKGLLLFIAALSVLISSQSDNPLPQFLAAWDRFCFFATFVSALGLLRVSAMRSRLVRHAGQVLIRQRPTWRYPTLSIGTAVFGMIINIGVIGLFGSMVQRSNSLSAAGGERRVQAVRERRMMLSILRGFALVPLLSPLGVTMAVMLSNMPSLRWHTIAPVALPTAVLMFAMGWLLDWVLRPRNLKVPPVDRRSSKPLWQFTALAAVITSAVFLCGWVLDVRLPVAVLIACPLSAFTWLSLQRRRLGGGTGARRAAMLLYRHSRLIFGANRNEVAILGGSAFLGALLVPAIDRDVLAEALLHTGLYGPWFAVAAMMAVILLSQIGLNPIVSVTLIAGLFADTHEIGLEPVVLAVALMSAWSLAMITSPFTAAMQVLEQLLQRSSYMIAWRWDGLFFWIIVPTLCVWVFVLHSFLG